AEFEATLDNRPLPKNRPVHVPAGGCLDFAGPKNGTSAWLAVGGGIVVPEVMGSRSTDRIAGIGGVGGRPLLAGDVLPAGPPPARPLAGTRALLFWRRWLSADWPKRALGMPSVSARLPWPRRIACWANANTILSWRSKPWPAASARSAGFSLFLKH